MVVYGPRPPKPLPLLLREHAPCQRASPREPRVRTFWRPRPTCVKKAPAHPGNTCAKTLRENGGKWVSLCFKTQQISTHFSTHFFTHFFTSYVRTPAAAAGHSPVPCVHHTRTTARIPWVHYRGTRPSSRQPVRFAGASQETPRPDYKDPANQLAWCIRPRVHDSLPWDVGNNQVQFHDMLTIKSLPNTGAV